jgi:hypothetical protein
MTLYDSSLKKFIMSAQVTERVGGLELLKKRWTFFLWSDFQFCQKSVYDRLPIQRAFYFGWLKFCWSSTLVKLLIKFVDSIVDQALNVFFFGQPGSTHMTRDPITWPDRWPDRVSKLWKIYIFDAFKDASYESNSKNVKDTDTIIWWGQNNVVGLWF